MTQAFGPSYRTSPAAFALDVRSWPIIECSAHRIQQIELLHLASRCDGCAGSPDVAARGLTVWCALASAGLVGVTWTWQQIAPNVLAIADPLAIRSNLRWISDDGQVLGVVAAAALHTRLVAHLPWQQSVGEAVRTNVAPPIVSWPSHALARC